MGFKMPRNNLALAYVAQTAGKLFFQLTGLEGDSLSVAASSTMPDGRTVPAEILVDSHGLVYIATPALDVSQQITAYAYDADGNRQELATISSDGGTPQVDNTLPNVDDLNRKFAAFTAAIMRIVNVDDELLATCVIEAFPYEPKDRQLPQVQVLDQNGNLVTDSFVDLGTNSRPDTRYPTEHRYLSTVSFRIPNNVGRIAVVVSLAGKTRIIALDAAQVNEIRDSTFLSRLPADQDPRYHDWYHMHHKASQNDLYLQRLSSRNLAIKPTFSIVVPLFKTPLDFLSEMANSVLAQSYPHFELLLVNASPEDAALRDAAEALCARDSRVRHIALEGNFGITENTNAGIRAATGDFIAFLDHDDTIEPDLLYCYAKGINDYPTTDLLYCDEDRLQDGRHLIPFFKPDWDPDLLCSENYVCHMLCVRKSIVDALPQLPDKRFDGSQDHNMTFLVGEKARNVYHARRILYHWRMHPLSTASAGVDAKPYVLEAERIAVQDHLDRCGINATAVMGKRLFGRCEVVYHFDEYPLVSIVIPNKDARQLLDGCISSILEKTTWPNFEIVVVENNSTDEETFAFYEQLKARDERIFVVTSHTNNVFNFSKVINDGFAAAHGDYLLMLNNDTEIREPDWLHHLMGPCMREEIGAVGCKLLYPDDTYQHVGVALGRTHFGPFHIDTAQPSNYRGPADIDYVNHQVSAVTGACLLTPRSVFDAIGGLDESLPINYNDIDYCLKVRQAGYAVLLVNSTQIYHFESVTRTTQLTNDSAAGLSRDYGVFMRRWQRYLTLGEPFYNLNYRGSNAYRALEL